MLDYPVKPDNDKYEINIVRYFHLPKKLGSIDKKEVRRVKSIIKEMLVD